MSSKSKKQSSAAPSSTTTEPPYQPQVPSTPSTPSRPVSPSRISRIQEKAELANLNDRLAAYIERNRSLENENSQLKGQVTKQYESRQVDSVKRVYEEELSDTRQTLDTIAREKAQAELSVAHLNEEVTKLKEKLAKANTDNDKLDKRATLQEVEIGDLQTRVNQGIAEFKQLEAKSKDMTQEIKSLEDRLNDVTKQLDEETIGRVDLENRNQSLNEELSFQRQLYQKELEEVRVNQSEVSETYTETIKQQFEEKLASELNELRAENEERISQYRQELEDKYEIQLGAAQDDLDRKNADLKSANSKVKQLNASFNLLKNELSETKHECRTLKDKVADLNKLIEQERDWNAKMMDRRDDEVAKLKRQLEELIHEHQDLIDDKIKLDSELAVYRKLLEGEETRLNITVSPSATPSRASTSVFSPSSFMGPSTSAPDTSSYTPKAYVSRGNKRKRINLLEEETNSNIHVDSTTNGQVEISDHDQDGKYVKLTSKADKDISLSGWQLLRTADGLETRYKFPRTISIEPGQTITVWSSDSSAIHSPPNDIVMKAQTWFTADKMDTVLYDGEGAEMASRITEKQVSTHSRLSRQGYFQEDEAEEQQKCAIM